MSTWRFSMIANGLFNSKLIYGISVWGGVWNLPGVFDLEKRNSPTLTKEDNRQLQVLQNSVCRLITGLPLETRVTTLLDQSKQLSVQQLAAYHCILQVYKTYHTHETKYFYDCLFPVKVINYADQRTSRSMTNNYIRVEANLSLTRSGFMYKASRLWSSLPSDIQNKVTVSSFKTSVKKWEREIFLQFQAKQRF